MSNQSASITTPHVAAQLAADGTRVATECTGHLGLTLPLLSQQTECIPFFGGDLGVRHPGFHSLGRALKPGLTPGRRTRRATYCTS